MFGINWHRSCSFTNSPVKSKFTQFRCSKRGCNRIVVSVMSVFFFCFGFWQLSNCRGGLSGPKLDLVKINDYVTTQTVRRAVILSQWNKLNIIVSRMAGSSFSAIPFAVLFCCFVFVCAHLIDALVSTPSTLSATNRPSPK